MWVLYVLAVIGATTLVALLAYGVTKVIDFFSEIDAFKSKCDRIDDRCWDNERRIATVHDNLISINNDISMLTTRMNAVENAIQDVKKEDTANA